MSDTTTSSATSTTPAAGTGPSRAVNVTVWVLQVLAAAMFVYAGLAKLSGDPVQLSGFEAMGLGVAGMYIIGVLEIAGAVGVLLPGIAGFAGLCLSGLMIGAVIVTVQQMGLAPLVAVPLLTFVVVAIIAWVRRRSTVAFVRLALGR
jgi:hypothetical protein